MTDQLAADSEPERRQILLRQQCVQGVGKIGRAVDQRAVQIEDDRAHGPIVRSGTFAHDSAARAHRLRDQPADQRAGLEEGQMPDAGKLVDRDMAGQVVAVSGRNDGILAPDDDAARPHIGRELVADGEQLRRSGEDSAGQAGLSGGDAGACGRIGRASCRERV